MNQDERTVVAHWLSLSLVVAFAWIAPAGCDRGDGSRKSETAPPTAGPGEVVRAFEVTGMTCSGCESHVCDEVKRLAEVKSATASHESERVWIVASAEAGPADEDVIGAIRKAGDQYRAKAVEK